MCQEVVIAEDEEGGVLCGDEDDGVVVDEGRADPVGIVLRIDGERLPDLVEEADEAVVGVEPEVSVCVGRDIGDALGCGAILSALCRTETAGFPISRCVDLDELTSDNVGEYILPADTALQYRWYPYRRRALRHTQ